MEPKEETNLSMLEENKRTLIWCLNKYLGSTIAGDIINNSENILNITQAISELNYLIQDEKDNQT